MTHPLAPTDGRPREIDGRYRLLAELGRGGMAVVHRAHDHVLDRHVAVKLLHPHLTADERVLDRFRREARAAASLLHPGVVAVHDWGMDGDTPFLVMELVEGRSLRAVLDLRGRLRPGEALSLLAPAVGGLAAAHDAGLVHRDVTPSNLLLTLDGASKLGDFGLARTIAATTATFADAVVGSPHYLAPEAARGEPLDARADVYSLGCVLYECLTGRPPFDGDSPVAIASRHGTDRVPAPSDAVADLSPDLDRLVARATAHDPDDRHDDAGAFAAAFAAAVPDGPVAVDLRDGSAVTVVLPDHATRVLDELDDEGDDDHRRRWPRVLASLLVLALLAGGGWLGWDQWVAPVTDVPVVTGLVASEARATLEDAGFRVVVADERVFDRSVPENVVVTQSTTEPARIMVTTIELTLSAGPRTGELPALVGLTEDAARAAVDALRLDLGIVVEEAFDEEQPIGTVLRAAPSGGATVAEGTTITLTTSAGPAPVTVPDVVGRTEAAAVAELVALGLSTSVQERRYDPSPAGTVLATTPSSGTSVTRGAEVGLVVSDGPEPIEVPDVEGAAEADAVAQLEAAGFDVDVRYVRTLLPFARGRVDAQDPEPGTVRPRGSTVRIFVWS